MMTPERIKQIRSLFPVNEGETYYAEHPTVIINELLDEKNIEWVIVGGESGANRRPFDTDWARSIRDQCKEFNVPFFMKQVDKKIPIPNDLMIREFPDNNREDNYGQSK